MLTTENLAKRLMGLSRTYGADQSVVFPIYRHHEPIHLETIPPTHRYVIGPALDDRHTILPQWQHVALNWREFQEWLEAAIDFFGSDLAVAMKGIVFTVAR